MRYAVKKQIIGLTIQNSFLYIFAILVIGSVWWIAVCGIQVVKIEVKTNTKWGDVSDIWYLSRVWEYVTAGLVYGMGNSGKRGFSL